MTPAEEAEVRRRQRSGSLVTGLILGALVILIFAVAIAKMS